MALKLDILANTRQLVSEMRKGGASVEDVSDALDDLASNGGTVERSFRDLAKAGAKSTGELKKGFRDLKDEAGQSGRETAASFSGEWSDVGDFIQETVANGLGGLGPLGLAAGLAGAAGIGAVTAELQKQQEEAQKLKEYFAAAYQSAAEEGRQYLDVATIQKQAFDILYSEDRVDDYNRAVERSKRIGIDVNTLVLAQAGDQEALRIAIEATAAAQEDLGIKSGEGSRAAQGELIRERDALNAVMTGLEGLATLHDENARRATQAQAIRDQLHEQEREQVDRTMTAAQSRYEGLAAVYGKPLTVKVNVDDSALVAARQRAEAWARNGLQVGVTALNGGKVWQ